MSFKICKQRTPTSPPNKYKFDFSATNMFLFCYIIIGIFLIGFSPIIFLLCNIIILCGLIYSKKVDLWKLLILNIFFLIFWFLFFGSYVYLLTHEPSIPFYSKDITILDPVNMILIVHDSFDKLKKKIKILNHSLLNIVKLVVSTYGWTKHRLDRLKDRTRGFFSCNHVDIGILYIQIGAITGGVFLLLSLIIRIDLLSTTNRGTLLSMAVALLRTVIDYYFDVGPSVGRDLLIAVGHFMVMLFWVALPILYSGFGSWFVPILIGAPDLAFPRLNKLSLCLLRLSVATLLLGLLLPMLPVLAEAAGQSNWSAPSTIIRIVSAGGIGSLMLSYTLTSINFVYTIFNMRAKEMTFRHLPLFVWSVLLTSFLLQLSLPIVIAVMTLIEVNPSSFYLGEVGTLRLYNYLTQALSHAEVYWVSLFIMILRGFFLGKTANKAKFNFLYVVYGMLSLGVFWLIVWGTQLYRVEIEPMAYFAGATLLILVLSPVAIIYWLTVLWKGRGFRRTPALFVLGSFVFFTIGGATGVVLANSEIDISLLENAYTLTHIHYALSMGAAFLMYGGIYFWFDKITGVSYNETLGLIHFSLFFYGTNIIFYPMQFLGLFGLQNPTFEYVADFLTAQTQISTMGFYVVVLSLFTFLLVLHEAFYSSKLNAGVGSLKK